MKIIAATLLCDRKAGCQTVALPAITRLRGVCRLYVNIQTDGHVSYRAAEDLLAEQEGAGQGLPFCIERWHRSGWEGSEFEEDRDQRRLLGITTARNMAIDYALYQGAEWLLFVDADVVPESDGVFRLLALGERLCGGLVPGRGEHAGLRYVFPSGLADPRLPDDVEDRGDRFRCGFGTAGYMLIHHTVFSQLRFRFNPLARAGCVAISEDPAYCLDAVRLGLTDGFYVAKDAPAKHLG